MAQRAILLGFDSGNVDFDVQNTNMLANMSMPWPGTLTPNAPNIAMRDAIIANQPEGFDLQNGDVIFYGTLVRASLL